MRRPQVPRGSGANRQPVSDVEAGVSPQPAESSALSAGPYATPSGATSPRRVVGRPQVGKKRPGGEATSGARPSEHPAGGGIRKPRLVRKTTLVEPVVEKNPAVLPAGAAAAAEEPEAKPVALRLRGYFVADRAAQAFSSKTKTTSHLEERRKEVRKAKWRVFGWYGIALVATVSFVSWVIWGFFFSAFFALDKDLILVQNEGERVTTQQVQETLTPWVGTPLPRLNLSELNAAVEAIPMVKTATVSRDWPNGVGVELVLRTPSFCVSEDGKWSVYDTDGVMLFAQAEVFAGTTVAEVAVADPQERARALHLLNTVKSKLDQEILGEVAVFRSDGSLVEMVLKSGALVKWGDSSEPELKLKVLKVLLSQVPAKVYDVSVPGKPVTA